MKSKITIGILVFEEAEELDFVGPYEVFGMAAEFGEPCRAVVIAETDAAVRCAHGLRVLPDCTIENAPHLDLLIVPGGRGARLHARNNPKILEFVRQQKGAVASVCTGAMVLAAAGVLDGMEATTHCAHYDQLREFQRGPGPRRRALRYARAHCHICRRYRRNRSFARFRRSIFWRGHGGENRKESRVGKQPLEITGRVAPRLI